MVSENICSFIKTSFCDWPGKIVSIIFLRGCNFRCPTCHNLELLESNDTIDFNEILGFLSSRKEWIDGITISGGEPTIYKDLLYLVYQFRKLNLEVKIDTNGSNPDMIENLLPFVSNFAIDIKGPFHKYYLISGRKIMESEIKYCFNKIFSLATKNPQKFYFRTTLIPELSNKDIHEVQEYLPSEFKIHFQNYQN